jgi:Ulp1 family protease
MNKEDVIKTTETKMPPVTTTNPREDVIVIDEMTTETTTNPQKEVMVIDDNYAPAIEVETPIVTSTGVHLRENDRNSLNDERYLTDSILDALLSEITPKNNMYIAPIAIIYKYIYNSEIHRKIKRKEKINHIFLIYNLPGHWIFIYFYLDKNAVCHIHIYDSNGQTKDMDGQNKDVKYYKKMIDFERCSRLFVVLNNSPTTVDSYIVLLKEAQQQRDGYNCGIFAFMALKKLYESASSDPNTILDQMPMYKMDDEYLSEFRKETKKRFFPDHT